MSLILASRSPWSPRACLISSKSVRETSRQEGHGLVDLLAIEIYDGLLFDILQTPKKENAGMLDCIMYGYIDTIDFRSHGENEMHLGGELKPIRGSLLPKF
ncbi:hypothetical protein I315_03858 [Cryptococcus gattii Ru294]|nr:hypothetical protein I315_03858 [Cryptococcus gattii Ru294]